MHCMAVAGANTGAGIHMGRCSFAGLGAIQLGYAFEMLVGVVQALIFSGLTLVFATMAAETHEGEHTEGT